MASSLVEDTTLTHGWDQYIHGRQHRLDPTVIHTILVIVSIVLLGCHLVYTSWVDVQTKNRQARQKRRSQCHRLVAVFVILVVLAPLSINILAPQCDSVSQHLISSVFVCLFVIKALVDFKAYKSASVNWPHAQ